MTKVIYIVLVIIFLSGCVAFVNQTSEGRKVKSFIITEQETLDILRQTDQKSPEKEFEINLFQKP